MKTMKKSIAIFLCLLTVFTVLPFATPKAEAAVFAGGKGTKSNPYLISTEEQFEKIADDLDAHYALINDITLTDYVTIGGDEAFSGSFLGNGYTITVNKISGLPGETVICGLFGKVTGEINFVNVYYGNNAFNGNKSILTGGIAAVSNGAVIKNCTVSGKIFAEASNEECYVGGIIGGDEADSPASTVTITGCTNNARIDAVVYSMPSEVILTVGGICGYSEFAKISYCANKGEISVDLENSYSGYTQGAIIGGISAIGGTINCCYNSGNIYGTDVYGFYYDNSISCSGISSMGDISNCYNTGLISARAYDSVTAAGIAILPDSVKNCYNAGIIQSHYERYSYAFSGENITYDCDNIRNCYALSGKGDTTGCSGVYSTSQFTQKSTFYGYDFDSVWFIDNSTGYPYPQLRGNEHNGKEISISVSEASTHKKEYNLGDSFKLDGLLIDVKVGTEVYKNVKVQESWVSGFDSSSAGEKTITINYSGATATFKVTVNAVVTSVSIPETLTLTKGSTSTLKVTIKPENATNKKITWSSSDESVAKVDSKGVVTAVNPGTATITAKSANGKKDTCKVTVTKSVSSVKLDKKQITFFYKGQTETLTATVLPEEVPNKAVTWASSNTSVATVDKNGKVKAVGNGTAKEGNKTAVCKVTVNIVVMGDVDGNGSVTAADARLALRKSVSLETYKEGSAKFFASDMDGNGSVTAADARIILRISVSLETSLRYDPSHTHSYTKKVIAPTCASDGYTVNSCKCGQTYNSDLVKAAGHKWTPATCNTAKTCSVCKKVEGNALGHDYKVTVVAPTCKATGYTLHKCSRCEASYKDKETAKTSHSYYNNACRYCGLYDLRGLLGSNTTKGEITGYLNNALREYYSDVADDDSIARYSMYSMEAMLTMLTNIALKLDKNGTYDELIRKAYNDYFDLKDRAQYASTVEMYATVAICEVLMAMVSMVDKDGDKLDGVYADFDKITASLNRNDSINVVQYWSDRAFFKLSLAFAEELTAGTIYADNVNDAKNSGYDVLNGSYTADVKSFLINGATMLIWNILLALVDNDGTNFDLAGEVLDDYFDRVKKLSQVSSQDYLAKDAILHVIYYFGKTIDI